MMMMLHRKLKEKMEVVRPTEQCVSTFDVSVNSLNTSENFNVGKVNEASVSIFDIIRDSDYPFNSRPNAKLSQGYSHLERQSNLVDDMSQPKEGTC